MDAYLNVTKREPFAGYDDSRIPSEIHTHDVLLGDQIVLEALGQRYAVHVIDITPETVVLDVEGLCEGHDLSRPGGILHRYVLPRNSPLSLSIPMIEHSPTWTLEWIRSA